VCGYVFFQAEDGIRDFHVTGVQTCALPIWRRCARRRGGRRPSTGPPGSSPARGGETSVGNRAREGSREGVLACDPVLLYPSAPKIGRASCRERVWTSVGAV